MKQTVFLLTFLLIFLLTFLAAFSLQAQDKPKKKKKKGDNIFLLPQDCSLREIVRNRCVGDTSFVYGLPYEKGKKVLMVQGYNTPFSHKDELALDFKVRQGSKICAARAGVVLATESKFDKAKLKKEYLKKANYVVILHEDSTIAGYWHLAQASVLVNVGDTVSQGQPIGLSGHTGFSAFPHLHFYVRPFSTTNKPKVFMPTRFATHKGVRYLRSLRRHKW